MTTLADELRTAAETLRRLAEAATPSPWTETGIGDFGWTVGSPTRSIAETEDNEQGRTDAAYIAAMHPGIGVALADWLDETARNSEPFGSINTRAVEMARAINGGEQL